MAARRLRLPFLALVLAAVVLAALGGGRSARAQSAPSGSVQAIVWQRTADGSLKPLAGVTVEVRDGNGQVIATTTSAADGTLLLRAEPGTYGLLVYADGNDGVAALNCDGGSAGWDPSAVFSWSGRRALWSSPVVLQDGRTDCRELLFSPTPPAPAATAAAQPQSPLGGGHPVYLTFDDGYVYLCQTVDLVISLGIHATFFLTGQAILTYPACVQRLVAAGNRLANHTYAHENLTRLSQAQIVATLQRTENAALSVAGVSTAPLCRPPYGAVNAAVRAAAAAWGCRMVLWDRDTLDWAGVSPQRIIQTALSVSCSGEVILMHTQAWPREAQALPVIVQTLRSRGCDFPTL
jgi:peptidoglycan/xylan/chitin deacetylase (PgdA/CDA1 family)